MKIKQILVPLTGETKALHVVDMAFQIARESSAHVIGTDTVSPPQLFVDQTGVGAISGYYDEIYKTAEKAQSQRRLHAFAAFEASRKTAGIQTCDQPGTVAGVTAEWVSGENYEGKALAALGRLTDLIVVHQPGETPTFADQQLFEDAAFHSHRPILVVPPKCPELGQRALIAWNGSAQACNAVNGALPLLSGLANTEILQVGELKPGAISAAMLQKYLGWHGIASRITHTTDQSGQTANIIFDRASSTKSTFMVMGAYGHSRLRELVLGGVTQTMIAKSPYPIIMAH